MQHDQVVLTLQIRNIDVAIDGQAYRNIGAVRPHAGECGLHHELVPGMTTGHKSKWCLHFHGTKAGCSMTRVCPEWRQVSYRRANAAANRLFAFRAATSLLPAFPSSFRSSSLWRNF